VADGDPLASGVGDALFRFDLALGVALGDGVGEIFFLGETVGDGVGADFAVRFRCFRAGLGVGVASKTFLIFVPNDSSALPGATTAPKHIAAMRRIRTIILTVERN
jgi:hypothetical protein